MNGGKRVIDKAKYDYNMIKTLEEAEIEAYTYVYPCESRDKVIRALLNVVNGEVEVCKKDELVELAKVRGRGTSHIFRIFNQFRSRRVLATVRQHLLKYLTPTEITMYLHKQSAFVGVYSLCDVGESTLGEIVVKIRVKNPRDVVYWLTRF